MATPIQLMRERARGLKASLGVAHRFRGDLLPHWRRLLGAFLCSVGYAAMRLAEPWPLKFIYDNVLVGLPLQTPSSWVDRALVNEPMLILGLSTAAILGLAALRGV